MQIFGQDLANIAANAGYILTISALISLIVKNFFIKPFEKKRKKEQREHEIRQEALQVKIFEEFAERMEPITQAMKALTEFTERSDRDRQNLNRIADVNTQAIGELDSRMDNHEVRITVLEDRTGVKKVAYKEVYKGEDE